MNVADALNEFLDSCRADGLSPATIKWYTSLLNAYASDCEDMEVRTVTTALLRQYIIALRGRGDVYAGKSQTPVRSGGLSPVTINGHIRALHAFWAWVAREYAIANPMGNIRQPPHIPPEPKAISPADFVKLFNATGDNLAGIRDRAILAFLADTGCRLGGLLSLTINNIQRQERRAIVIEKGGKPRIVVFTLYTSNLLYQWIGARPTRSETVFTAIRTGEPLTASGVDQMLTRLKTRAGVQGRVNPHSFRHNFARAYLTNGGDIVTLAKLLGHTNINTTAAYYAIFSQDELAELHEKYSPMRNMR